VLLANGSRKPLTLRRAEILALLDSRRQGFSADELAYELYGDAGTPATVRIEMHRIRAALGNAVASTPYRLEPGLVSDARRVGELLRAGQVREAVAAYTAPLLGRSAAMAVAQLRGELDAAVAAAVRACGSAEVLMQWLATDMGAGDAGAAAALGRLLGGNDPRYLAVRARVDRLDHALRR
jgi:hypothetical protein